jgi:aerobic-type carbon monoxide dehydrogenase small subunit (CoxS/CutS family)
MEEEKDKTEKQGQISRREFLKDAGLIVGGATVGSMAILSACKGGETATETVTNTNTVTKTVTTTVTTGGTGGTSTVTVTATTPPGATTENIVKLTVNGHEYQIQVQPNWTLEYVLREKLGFVGIKTFCKRGACGSCTVIINSRPVLSCMLLAIECNNKNIETIEGIANDKNPLINAYINNECAQCGYCTPGFVVTAKALLDRKPNPSEDDIKEALAGNLCRCGTYPQHIQAVLEAASDLRGGK